MKLLPYLRILFSVLLAVFLSTSVSAQELIVRSMKFDITDATGSLSENLERDNNGNYGGLVRVYLTAPNARFEGAVLRQQKHSASEYWVVVAKDYYRLKVVVPGFQPLDINFRDYNITGIEPQRTYVLSINVPQVVQSSPVDDGMRYLAMTVEPKNSTVLVDDKPRTVDENGEVIVFLPMGRHTYKVIADGYAAEEGSVNVTNNTEDLKVRLASTKATLRVECDTKGAMIFVNGQQKSFAPWSGSLSEGSYQVEARLDGYRSQKQSVTLAQKETRTLRMPSLQMIVGRLNVDCTPIGSEVYVDGKKVGTSPNIFRDIAVGSRSVEIRKQGYETLKKTVVVKENEQANLGGKLTAIATSAPQSSSISNGVSSSHSGKETFTVNGVKFTMVRVDGGTFMMGASKAQDKKAADNEAPVHKVTLTNYMIGETEVTQALWLAVMGNNPSSFTGNLLRPVENVSWNDCQEFIKKLNTITGKAFRLLTEAEWEFAARGGNKTKGFKYCGGNDPEKVAWYTNNSKGRIHPVGKKRPNELGLYDMSGNVWEWCSDWYDSYGSSSQTNPNGASSGANRVYRGGSWSNDARSCNYTYRNYTSPNNRIISLGLRLAL